MPHEGFKPHIVEAERSEPAVSQELLDLIQTDDSVPVAKSIEILKKEIQEAPIVGRSLAAIKGRELVIPITTALQKQRILDAFYDLGIFPWEENGVLVVDHHRDMHKVLLAGLIDEPTLKEELVLPENTEVLSFPLTRPDTLSKHLKERIKQDEKLPNELRAPKATKTKETFEDVPLEEGLDTELQDLLNRFDQGLVDDTDEVFQSRIGIFPTLTLFPRQYVWQGKTVVERSTGKEITLDERNELYSRAKEGDLDAMNRALRMHAGLVLETVVRIKEKFGGDADDLFQEGMIALTKAIQKHDPEKGSLSTYAMYWLEEGMRRFAYEYRHIIDRPQHLRSKVNQYYKRTKTEDGSINEDNLNSTELKEFEKSKWQVGTSLGRERLERSYFLGVSFSPVTTDADNLLDQEAYSTDNLNENLSDRDIPPEVLHKEIEDGVVHALQTLTEREERILRFRYGLSELNNSDRDFIRNVSGENYGSEYTDGLTYEEIGAIFNVTRERIRQIEAKGLRKLKHPSRSRHLRSLLDVYVNEVWKPYHYRNYRDAIDDDHTSEGRKRKLRKEIEELKKRKINEE